MQYSEIATTGYALLWYCCYYCCNHWRVVGVALLLLQFVVITYVFQSSSCSEFGFINRLMLVYLL